MRCTLGAVLPDNEPFDKRFELVFVYFIQWIGPMCFLPWSAKYLRISLLPMPISDGYTFPLSARWAFFIGFQGPPADHFASKARFSWQAAATGRKNI